MTGLPKEPGSHRALLGGIALFEGLTARFLDEVDRRAVLRSFTAGETLWLEGSEARAMHVVLSGEVRVVRIRGARQRVMHRESRGGTLGDVALFSAQRYPATAIAETSVQTLSLTEDALHALMAADARFAWRLLHNMADRVRHVLQVIDRVTSWSVQARVAQYLLERHARTLTESFALGMTQQQLAEELGTAREVVVRTLGDLVDAGVIERAARGRFRIADTSRLQEAARSSSTAKE